MIAFKDQAAQYSPSVPLLAHDNFVALPEGTSHLYAGGEAPVLRDALAALRKYSEDKSGGTPGRRLMEKTVAEARLLLGQRLGLPNPEKSIGFAASVSHGLDLVARAISGKPGQVIVFEDDFPSLPLAFDRKQDDGFRLQFVTPGNDCEERLAAQVNASTRAVCLSHVNYRTGRRIDLAPIAERCRAFGVVLIVDASHSAGVIEIPVDECDVIVSCAHKFLFGLHGNAFLYWNEKRLGTMPIIAPGWNSTRTYDVTNKTLRWESRETVSALEAGNPNFGSLYALKAALLQVGHLPIPILENHALTLADRFKSALAARSIEFLTPLERTRAAASVSVPCTDAEAISERLAERGILVSAGEGRLRFTFHAHNHLGDVERAAAAIAAVL
jgi:selenocysteine lyase/cysteine desulfurase